MNKRIITLLLTLCLLMGMATAAFAEDATSGPSAGTEDITGDSTFTSGANQTEIGVWAKLEDENITAVDEVEYNVELVWGDMTFAWGKNSQAENNEVVRNWDPETHTWDTNDEVDEANTGWYLVNEETALNSSYSFLPTDATQAHLYIYNHSTAAVDVNVAVNQAGYTTHNVVPKLHAGGFGVTTTTTVTDAGVDSMAFDLASAVVDEDYATNEADNDATVHGGDTAASVKVWPTETAPEDTLGEDPVAIAKLVVTISKDADATEEPTT